MPTEMFSSSETRDFNPALEATFDVLGDDVMADFGIGREEAKGYRVFDFIQDGTPAHNSESAMRIVVHQNKPADETSAEFEPGEAEIFWFEVRFRSEDEFNHVWLEMRLWSANGETWHHDPYLGAWRNQPDFEPWELADKIHSYAKGRRVEKDVQNHHVELYFGQPKHSSISETT